MIIVESIGHSSNETVETRRWGNCVYVSIPIHTYCILKKKKNILEMSQNFDPSSILIRLVRYYEKAAELNIEWKFHLQINNRQIVCKYSKSCCSQSSNKFLLGVIIHSI